MELEKLLMDDQLKLVAKSYDKGIDLGKQGVDSYENLPPYITNHPNYPCSSKCGRVKRFLTAPEKRLSSTLRQRTT